MWDAAASSSRGGNMKTDSSTVDRRGIPWTVAGVVFLVLVVFLMWQFRRETDPTRELAVKASRVDIVGRMELALASASEAEKAAVLGSLRRLRRPPAYRRGGVAPRGKEHQPQGLRPGVRPGCRYRDRAGYCPFPCSREARRRSRRNAGAAPGLRRPDRAPSHSYSAR